MNSPSQAMTFVVPGDLHLTTSAQPNYEAALCVVRQINEMIRPDFVQFIGDNVQDATEDQFQLFCELTNSLEAPYFALVGDHDICGDASAAVFRRMVGEPTGSSTQSGFRFVRLNTLEIPRLGFSEDQLAWLNEEFETARRQQERVVVFQHHYPYKVCEDFAGPGIDGWRELMAAHRPTAILCGHTHYGQVANNGQYPAIATRSIGDPEGGPPGYLLAHLDGDDFAVTYRTIKDDGPVVLITHPRDLLLATDAQHIVHDDDEIRVRIWSESPVTQVSGVLDTGARFELCATASGDWSAPLSGTQLAKGEHLVRVDVQLKNGQSGRQELKFFVDPMRRYTAVPDARPIVRTTAFC